jgi:dipeptidyl aminopeptidase/acylaminoacyl peptidase
MAVAGVVFSGITWSSPNTNEPTNPDDLYSGFQGTPALQIFALDGTPGALVTADSSGSDTIHGGDGVDWAPNQDLLVYPKDTAVTVNNYGQLLTLPVTALYLMAPVNDAVGNGQAAQLTFPRASASQTLSGPISTWETDFQPAFSPDGKQVAYLRAENVMIGASVPPETLSLRLVNVDGSNDHQLLSFQEGIYVSHVSWSPDGSKLVFDAGEEESDSGAPLPLANPATSSLWIVSTNGTEPTQLRGPAAAWPAWYPGPAMGAAPRLDLALVPQVGGPKLVLSWPAGNGNFVLQSIPGLGPQAAWQTEPTQPTIAGGQASVTLNTPGGAQFYRLAQP